MADLQDKELAGAPRASAGRVRRGPQTLPRAASDLALENDPVALALGSAFIFLLCAQTFGPLVVVGELLVLGALLVRTWPRAFDFALASAFLLALPAFAVLSTLWSDIPPQTMRYSAQLLLTVAAGLLLARAVPFRHFALVLFVGTAVASIVGIASGRTGASATGPVLIGLAGSKNQMGYITLAWLLSSLAVLWDRDRGVGFRLVALICIPAAAYMLWQGQVATALISAIVGTILFVLLCTAGWFGRSKRFVVLILALLSAMSLAAFTPQFVSWTERTATDLFQKDMTLTGRTYLWNAANELIAQRPIAGHGYRAIWMGPEGASLLARNRQKDGRAFNFHDTIREVAADLGAIGVVLLSLALIYGFLKLVLGLVDRATVARAFALTVFLVAILRIRTEVLFGPFVLDTVLLYAVLGYASAILIGAGVRKPRPRTSLRPEHQMRPSRPSVPARVRRAPAKPQ